MAPTEVPQEFEVKAPSSSEALVPATPTLTPEDKEFLQNNSSFIERCAAGIELPDVAEALRMRLKEAKKLFHDPRIEAELSRRKKEIDDKAGRDIAEARLLTINAVDRSVLEVLNAPLIIKGVPAARVGMAKLAYGRLGQAVVPEEKPPVPTTTNVYKALVSRTETTTVKQGDAKVTTKETKKASVEVTETTPIELVVEIPDGIENY